MSDNVHGSFTIVSFEKSKHETIWDEFVKNIGLFGTIYHTRQFINYHPSFRFVDASILVYRGDELVCVLPATLNTNNRGNSNHVRYFSYTGSTYGGPVIASSIYTPKHLPLLIDIIFKHYHEQIEFRLANPIYFSHNIDLLYWTLSTRLNMIPELAWHINTHKELEITNSFNLRMLNKLRKNPSVSCYHTDLDDDYSAFYEILYKSLKERHGVCPTHSLKEFMDLKERLTKKYVSLYLVKQSNNDDGNNDLILGGVFVVKVTTQCWYTFYICKNPDTSNHAAIPLLMDTIRCDAYQSGVPYLDYGICTENSGQILNTGLGEFKMSSLGGKSSARYLFLLR